MPSLKEITEPDCEDDEILIDSRTWVENNCDNLLIPYCSANDQDSPEFSFRLADRDF